jgi:hypothetical protein
VADGVGPPVEVQLIGFTVLDSTDVDEKFLAVKLQYLLPLKREHAVGLASGLTSGLTLPGVGPIKVPPS